MRWFELDLPVAFASTFLLDLLWIFANMTRFGKVAWKVVFRGGSTIGEAAVVTIVVLLGASHWYEGTSQLRKRQIDICRA
jgi:hypothetical protein